MVVEGDNRFHAILGNSGPAKFVNSSRLAPALIAIGARLRILGGQSDDAPAEDSHDVREVPLEQFYRVPRDEHQRENVLEPNQLIAQVIVPKLGLANATYEVRHGEGPDAPLAAASVAVRIVGGVVREARVVLGHVAPTPWLSAEAAAALVGHSITPATAERAGEASVARATPLMDNA